MQSFKNRDVIEAADVCGCYYCLKTFPPAEVIEFVDDEKTAICPYCGVDSVVPTDNREELAKLNEEYFDEIQDDEFEEIDCPNSYQLDYYNL